MVERFRRRYSIPVTGLEWPRGFQEVNPLKAELNPICHLLALLGGATIVVVRRLRVNPVMRIKGQILIKYFSIFLKAVILHSPVWNWSLLSRPNRKSIFFFIRVNGLNSIAVCVEVSTVRSRVRLPKEHYPNQKQPQQPKSRAEQWLLIAVSKRFDSKIC